jgi:hypothetical protein
MLSPELKFTLPASAELPVLLSKSDKKKSRNDEKKSEWHNTVIARH